MLTPTRPAPSQGQAMSLRCEQPLDEFAIQVYLLLVYPNVKYCTLYVSGIQWIRTKRTDDPINTCPRRTFQAGHKNIFNERQGMLDGQSRKQFCTACTRRFSGQYMDLQGFSSFRPNIWLSLTKTSSVYISSERMITICVFRLFEWILSWFIMLK